MRRHSEHSTARRSLALGLSYMILVTTLACQPGAVDDSLAQAERTSNDVFRLEQLADGVYAAVVHAEPTAYAFANSLVVVGSHGVLVVDTQQSPRAASALIDLIAEVTDAPVRWVVNTHWHGDHVNGNVAYRTRWPDAAVMATPATATGMRGPGAEMRADELESLPRSIEEREGWLRAGALPDGRPLDEELRAQVESSLAMRKAYLDELRELEVVLPDVLIDEPTTVDVGGRGVRLIPVGPAHTEGDMVVLVEGEGIVAVGDLLEEGPPWIEGADLAGWAVALRRIEALEPVSVLPSHAAGAAGRALLEGEAALFDDLVAAATEAAGRDDGASRLAARLERHRTFVAGFGASSEAFDRWVEEASAMALAQLATGR